MILKGMTEMGMTMTQKILAAHAGLPEVKAGQLIEANLDLVLGNDVTCPVAINVFEENGADSVFDNTKIAMIMDHFTPNKDIKAAEQVKISRQFADKYDIKNYQKVKSCANSDDSTTHWTLQLKECEGNIIR